MCTSKDYNAQWTDEGIRLVRCAIGDGAVPFRVSCLRSWLSTIDEVTAVLEPGALEARHVRFFTAAWWHGYAPRPAEEFCRVPCGGAVNRLADDADWRTPWERGDDAAAGPIRTRHDPPVGRQHARPRHSFRRGNKELKGKVAFVTGRDAAWAMSWRGGWPEMGADVAVHDLSFEAPAKYGEHTRTSTRSSPRSRRLGCGRWRRRQYRRPGGGGANARKIEARSARSTSWSIAPAAISAPRAISPARTMRCTSV